MDDVGSVDGTQDLGVVVRAIGWIGHLVEDIPLAGTRVSVVVGIDRHAHACRQATDTAWAMLDSDVISVWEWPEARPTAPPSVVSLVGVIARCGGNRSGEAVRIAKKWNAFAPSVVVLPQGQSISEPAYLECGYRGLGILRRRPNSPEVDVLRHPRDVGLNLGRTGLDRWVEEVIYDRLLKEGVLN